MKLPLGKIPLEILKEVVFKNLGAYRREVVLGPSAGVDGAVIDMGDKSLITSMDPVTGAVEHIGWLALNVNANDVATFGARPAFFLSCILLPENGDRENVEEISVDMSRAATELGIAIVGGHCEVTPGLRSPVVIGCMIGLTNKGNYVTAAGANAGDKIILTKSVGIEGTSILALEKESQLKEVLDSRMLTNAKEFYRRISVVKDAETAFKTGKVHAMHDPTEGGVAGALHEMADASNLGFKILEEKIRTEPETLRICNFFRIDPLQLIASGSLLIATDPGFAENVVQSLKRKGIAAEIIGHFVSTPDRVITRKNAATEDLPRPASDHLWRALEDSRT